MSDGTKIEWAANADGTPGATWNPIRARNKGTGAVGWFCVHASDGCKFCYAERLNVDRFGNGVEFKAQNRDQVEIFVDAETLTKPGRWRKPRTIFVCSMTDLFGEFVTDAMIDQVFGAMAMAQQHTFIVLTKRAKRMREYVSALPGRVKNWNCDSSLDYAEFPMPNVWIGVSVEDQKAADDRVPELLATPAAVRFLSVEPLLAPIDFNALPNPYGESRHPWLKPLWGIALRTSDDFREGLPRIDWVIVGGESGRGARPMHPRWAQDIRDACRRAGVPFFFKQWGEWMPLQFNDGEWPADKPSALRLTTMGARHPMGWPMQRLGKRTAGRSLDGVEHNDRPPIGNHRRTE